MAMTKKEIDGHIDHYNAYQSLPLEVMTGLFDAALTVASLHERGAQADSADEAKPAPAKRAKKGAE